MTVRGWIAATALLAPTAALSQTVDEIVARHLAARGGREALAAVRTLRMAGRALAGPGRQALVAREVARPGRIRTEFVFQGTTGVFAWDGSTGWRVCPLDGGCILEPMTPERRAHSIETGVRGRPRRLRIVVESVETNIPLDDDRFRMPR